MLVGLLTAAIAWDIPPRTTGFPVSPSLNAADAVCTSALPAGRHEICQRLAVATCSKCPHIEGIRRDEQPPTRTASYRRRENRASVVARCRRVRIPICGAAAVARRVGADGVCHGVRRWTRVY
jgi:hypothetical protein